MPTAVDDIGAAGAAMVVKLAAVPDGAYNGEEARRQVRLCVLMAIEGEILYGCGWLSAYMLRPARPAAAPHLGILLWLQTGSMIEDESADFRRAAEVRKRGEAMRKSQRTGIHARRHDTSTVCPVHPGRSPNHNVDDTAAEPRPAAVHLV